MSMKNYPSAFTDSYAVCIFENIQYTQMPDTWPSLHLARSSYATVTKSVNSGQLQAKLRQQALLPRCPLYADFTVISLSHGCQYPPFWGYCLPTLENLDNSYYVKRDFSKL